MKKLIPVLIFLILSLPCLAHDYLSQELINSINKGIHKSFSEGFSPSWILEDMASHIANKAIKIKNKRFLDHIMHLEFNEPGWPRIKSYGRTLKGQNIIRKASKEIDFANQKKRKAEANINITENSKKPQTIIIPSGSFGKISEVRKKMLEKTLESKLDDYFDIVPRELFEEAQEQAFQEMDADECTEERCISMIQEILQVPNAFQLILMVEEGDTQISITWNDMQRKRVEENFCEGCKTKQLRKMIEGLVEKLVGR